MRFADRVQETTTTTGTGTITLGGAVSGYRSFASIFAGGDRVPYEIQLGTEWEIGEGTFSGSTLTRENVLSSSNSGALVNFSAGSKLVWINLPAARVLFGYDVAFQMGAWSL